MLTWCRLRRTSFTNAPISRRKLHASVCCSRSFIAISRVGCQCRHPRELSRCHDLGLRCRRPRRQLLLPHHCLRYILLSFLSTVDDVHYRLDQRDDVSYEGPMPAEREIRAIRLLPKLGDAQSSLLNKSVVWRRHSSVLSTSTRTSVRNWP